ncbi:MAG: hypothetical protein K0S26_1150 [Bacteroidota bacterium]|jgi:aspartyl/asparaginyl beta-hydroxylase (cupin superfamily)|nr:hypothetical protein [Bacteroidota bacterium]
MPLLWFSIYDFSFDYKGTEPPFIDSSEFEWAEALALNFDKIKDELQRYLMNNQLEGYFNKTMVTKNNSWRTIALKTWTVELFKNQKHFPFTTALINNYPQIISASFNLLEPGSKIVPHCGDTNAIYRCHLGLDIPKGLPDCGFRVKDESRPWENGKWLVFLDAYNHEAWNNTGENRYIFLVDVLRDEFKLKKKLVSSTVLTSLFLQKRLSRYKVSLETSPFLVKLMTKTLRPFAQMALYIGNTLKFF